MNLDVFLNSQWDRGKCIYIYLDKTYESPCCWFKQAEDFHFSSSSKVTLQPYTLKTYKQIPMQVNLQGRWFYKYSGQFSFIDLFHSCKDWVLSLFTLPACNMGATVVSVLFIWNLHVLIPSYTEDIPFIERKKHMGWPQPIYKYSGPQGTAHSILFSSPFLSPNLLLLI